MAKANTQTKKGRGTPARRTGRRRGRQETPLDYEKIEMAAKLGATDEEIAHQAGMSYSGFRNRRDNDPKLLTALEKGKAACKTNLRALQWRSANRGNAAMLIFLGKNILGQRDKLEVGGKDDGPIAVEFEARLDRMFVALDRALRKHNISREVYESIAAEIQAEFKPKGDETT